MSISEPIKCRHCKKTIGYRRRVTSIGEPLGTNFDECVECAVNPHTIEEKAKKHKEAQKDYWEGVGEELKKYD